MSRRCVRRPVAPCSLAVLVIVGVVGAAGGRADDGPEPNAVLAGSRQLVLVVVPDWDASRGMLAAFDRDLAGAWRQRVPARPVFVGRHGSAWGLGLHRPPAGGPRKREGDGRSPAGVFAIRTAFGAAATCETGLVYRPLTVHDWCIDVAESPLYDRIVDARTVGADAVAGSTEPMRRDLHLGGDESYALGFVIDHNPGHEPGAGSCIFAHLMSQPPTPTAGCTALAEEHLRELVRWLDAEAAPRFVLLPAAELDTVAADWGLPPPPRDGSP